MTDIKVPTGPALVTIPGVELAQAGTWRLSSGEAVITRDDLAAAVGAVACPSVRNPIIKLGHIDVRFDGEPAVGWIGGMGLADEGETVTGDYRGLPAWLGSVMASAYPDRSIEATRNYRCQIGHTHPLVITAVALLGVTEPGIGTIASLQDVADLYQVTASASSGGEQLTSTIKGGRMPAPEPEPGPTKVAAAATSEDVRRAYYEQRGYDRWICEMQLDPELQLIVMDDASGGYFRVPVAIDGDTVTFEDAVPVAVEYRDKPEKVAASALVVFASRAESIPADLLAESSTTATLPDPPTAPVEPVLTPEQQAALAETTAADNGDNTQTPATEPVPGPTETEVTDMEFSDEQKAALRTALGLPDGADLDPAALIDGVTKLTASGEGSVSKGLPGTITLDRQVWDDQQERIKRLEMISAERATAERDRVIDAAIGEGKFAPSRRDLWTRQWDRDPATTREVIASLMPGIVPVADLGTPGGEDGLAVDAEFEHLFPRGV